MVYYAIDIGVLKQMVVIRFFRVILQLLSNGWTHEYKVLH